MAGVPRNRESMRLPVKSDAVYKSILRRAREAESDLPVRSYLAPMQIGEPSPSDRTVEDAGLDGSEEPRATGELRQGPILYSFRGDTVANRIGEGVLDGMMMGVPGSGGATVGKAVVPGANTSKRMAQVTRSEGWLTRRRRRRAEQEREEYLKTPEGQADVARRRKASEADLAEKKINIDRSLNVVEELKKIGVKVDPDDWRNYSRNPERFERQLVEARESMAEKAKAIASLRAEANRVGLGFSDTPVATLADADERIAFLTDVIARRKATNPRLAKPAITGSGVPVVARETGNKREEILTALDEMESKGRRLAIPVSGRSGALSHDRQVQLVNRYFERGGKVPEIPARPWGSKDTEVIREIVKRQHEFERMNAVTEKIGNALRRADSQALRLRRRQRSE